MLRKLKGTHYQYYWIRVRNNTETPICGIYGYDNIQVLILNGKFQIDSIITGQ